MLCLGLEATAHTFGIGFAEEDGGMEILGGARSMYTPPEGEGILPRDAADHHADVCGDVLDEALEETGVDLDDVDVVAFSQGPGMAPALRVGGTFARVLSQRLDVPLVGTNHPLAHIEAGKFTSGADDPVVVYVSGGNTQIIAYREGRYRIFGETEDIAIGNALDSFARAAELPSPGGPEIEKLAEQGDYVDLPYVVKGMDLSFTGILTEAEEMLGEQALEDICFSLQETTFAMLTEVTERALAHTDKDEVLLTGGVAANDRLTGMLDTMCEERGADLYVVDMFYSGDNGEMIAYTGLLEHLHGKETPIEESQVTQRWRVDDVACPWLG